MREDFRTAIRTLTKSPVYTSVAILVLALGVGANAAIFAVVDAVVFRALLFSDPDRLVAVGERLESQSPGVLASVAPQNYLDWTARQDVFEGLAAATSTSFTLLGTGSGTGPLAIRGQRVSANFFTVLGVQPQLGRAFLPHEETAGRHRTAIVSDAFWRSHFGSDPSVLGRVISLDGEPHEVVGILPRGFSYPVAAADPTQMWVPYVVPADERVRDPQRSAFYLQVIGRLKPGVSRELAASSMHQLSLALEREHPVWNKDRRINVASLHSHIVGASVESWMLLLLGGVGLVLVVACLNVASLLLARATARKVELAVRVALGANRWRLIRLMMTESLLLAALGTLAGLALAWWGVDVLRAAMPADVPRVGSIAINGRVLVAMALTAAGTSIAIGLVPAIHASRDSATRALPSGARGTTSGPPAERLRQALVVSEIALSTALLVGAGLFVTSFITLTRVQLGFDPSQVITAVVRLPSGQTDAASGTAALLEVIDRVREVGGVQYAGMIAGGMPLSGSMSRRSFGVPGRQLESKLSSIRWVRVTSDYHRAMGIPLRSGRYFADRDRAGSRPVVLINEAAARLYFHGEPAVGQRVEIDGSREIIGIVGDVRQRGPEVEVEPEAYLPLAQGQARSAHLVVRTQSDPVALLPAIRSAVHTVLPSVPLREAATLTSVVRRHTAQSRTSMLLLSLFGILGLAIAASGVYGFIAYITALRSREIGIRMALGATRGRLVTMMMRGTVVLIVLGVAIGSAGAWSFSSLAEPMLFRLDPTDPRVYGMAIATLLVPSLAACLWPAWRSASQDPTVVLRLE